MRISPFRIKVLTSTYELQLIKDATNQYKNQPKYIYEVVIAPDPNNDNTSPMNIVKSFVESSYDRASFKKLLPDWDNTTSIKYHELRPVEPKIREMPKAKVINLYNATFTIYLWERSNIYAVLIEDLNSAEDSLSTATTTITSKRVRQLDSSNRAKAPRSNQIKSGKDKSNIGLGRYRKFTTTSDESGHGTIFFDDLKPGSAYRLFITCSDILPYDNTFLWSDDDVIEIDFKTLHNPNLMGSTDHLEQLKQFKP